MCSSNDLPGTSFIHAAIKRGWKVVVHNRPGHVEPLTTPQFSVFGDWRDVEVAVRHIRKQHPKSHLAAVGFSAGVFPLLRYLEKTGSESGIDAAVSVSGSIQLQGSLDNCWWLFEKIFLSEAKQFFFAKNEMILRTHDTAAYDACMAATQSEQFLRACTPFIMGDVNGTWEDVQHLLDPFPAMMDIKTPILFLNALDDPISPIDPNHYDAIFRTNPHLLLALSPTGSHCPFLNGCFSPEDYSMTTSLEFIAHQVQLSSVRKNATSVANKVKLKRLYQSFSPEDKNKKPTFSPRTNALRKRVPLGVVPVNSPSSVGVGGN